MDSDYFALRKDACKMLSYILSLYPNWDSPKLAEEAIYRYVYENEVFDKAQLHRVRSAALDILEQFIIQESLNKESVSQKMFLLDFYLKNNLFKQYESVWKDIHKKENITEDFAKHYYYQKLRLQQHYIDFEAAQQRQWDASEYNWHTNLEIFYTLIQLEHAVISLNRSRIYSDVQLKETPDLLIKKVTETPYLYEVPAIKVYFYILQIMLQSDGKLWDKCKATFKQYRSLFHVEEIQRFYACMTNYCIRSILGGKQEYQVELFELYQMQLSDGTIYDRNDYLQVSLFKNIVLIALRLQKIAWVQKFLTTESERLAPDEKEDVLAYSYALLYFQQQKYKEVCKKLVSFQPVDVFFDLGGRILLIQTYYEMKDYDALADCINRMRVFLSRQKSLSESHKDARKNFASFILKLVNLVENEENALRLLQDKIQQTNPVTEKVWLMEKIANKLLNIQHAAGKRKN